jgi:AraC family transcriptional regulator
MTPVEKALWYIESHFAEDVTLDDVASASGVSRFHLVRAFGATTGRSVMRHVRGRRLSEAARRLAAGAPDILSVALEAGYGSHEAFTRAFRDEFGHAPETVRASASLANLMLTEPSRMSENLTTLPKVRLVEGRAMLLAGLSQRYNDATIPGVQAQWQRFAPFIGNIAGEIAGATYGVCHNGDDEGNVDYLSAVEVTDFSGLTNELARLRIAPARYAVFAIEDHVSAIRKVWRTIWERWLPDSGHALADAPFFERYGESFNPQTGAGGFEIWLPLGARHG